MASGTAWLLTLNQGLVAATGELEIVHLLQHPVLHSVPGSPPHCRHVVVWAGRLLPAFDLAAWVSGNSKHTDYSGQPETLLAAVAAYQEGPNLTPSYGALLVADIPRRVEVDDAQACALPAEPQAWQALAVSCFEHTDQAVPIIDLQRVFTGLPVLPAVTTTLVT